MSQAVSRRQFLAAAAAAAAAAAVQGEAVRRPNIVLLVADDQRADMLGCAGHSVLKTPHIDALAAGGVRFTNSFATTAICMSSRASLLTGLHTATHGVESFYRELDPALWAASYPMRLKAAGYRIGFVGKWGVGVKLPTADYDYFDGFAGQGFYYEPGRQQHLTPYNADRAVDFLHGCRADRPFCLAVSFKASHPQDEGRLLNGLYPKYPYDRSLQPLYDGEITRPPPADSQTWPTVFDRCMNRLREGPDFHPDTYQQAMRDLYRLVTGIDLAVGKITRCLAELGFDDNTVILYTSDHGSFYGEHNFGGKWLMHEPSIRTPMILFDPRLPKTLTGKTRDEMALNLDVPATLLDLAGLPPQPAPHAKSLLPLARGKSVPWRKDWFYENHFVATPDMPIVASEGVRTDTMKYVRYIDTSPVFEQLYDLRRDPIEATNRVNDPGYQPELNRLRQRWWEWHTQLRGPTTRPT